MLIFQGIHTGSYLSLFSKQNSDVTSKIYGPTFDPRSSGNCYIRFWISMEGNSTKTGKYILGLENVRTGAFTELYRSIVFPFNQFGFVREEHLIYKLAEIDSRSRLIIQGSFKEFTMLLFLKNNFNCSTRLLVSSWRFVHQELHSD